MGRTQNWKALHHVTLVWRPASAQEREKSHKLVTVEEIVVLRANYQCTKSDSTQWCQEAAACPEVRPCEHRRTAKANNEKADAAGSCGGYRHGHENNMGHGAPSRTTSQNAGVIVSNGSGAPTCSQTDSSAWQVSW